MDKITSTLFSQIKNLKGQQRDAQIMRHLEALDFARSEALKSLPSPQNRTANQVRAFHILIQVAQIEQSHAEAMQKLSALDSEIMRQFKARELEEQRTVRLSALPALPKLSHEEQRDVFFELRRHSVQAYVESAIQALQELLVA